MDYNRETTDYDDDIVIDVRRLINNLWRCISRNWGLMLVLIITVSALVIIAEANRYQPQYRSSCVYVVSKTGNSLLDVTAAKYLGTGFEETLKGAGLYQEIAASLGLDQDARIPAQITAEYMEEVNIVTISAVADSYPKAREVMEIIRELYPDYASTVLGIVKLSEVEGTPETTSPVNTFSTVRSAVVGLVGGGVICLIWIMMYSLFQPSIQSRYDIERIANIRCLTQLPDISRRHSLIGKKSKIHKKEYEKFQQALRTFCIRFHHKNDGQAAIMITSSIEREGRSTIAYEMGRCFADIGRKTVLVCLDRYAQTPVPVDGAKKSGSNLVVMTPGVVSGDAMRTNQKLEKLLTRLKKNFEFIIIDAPPAAIAGDVVGKYADHTIYVVKQGAVNEKQVKEGIEVLQENDLQIWGYILNYVDSGVMGEGKYGKYGKYSKYGYSKEGGAWKRIFRVRARYLQRLKP